MLRQTGLTCSVCCTAVDIAPALQASQFLTIVNTVISLLGSCFATFAVSALVDNRFNIMHVQACCPGPRTCLRN